MINRPYRRLARTGISRARLFAVAGYLLLLLIVEKLWLDQLFAGQPL